MSLQGTSYRDDIEQDKLRRRRPHHKSKTGCYACKNRRVKCDEVWPVCKRCQYNHRLCQRDQTPQDLLSTSDIDKELRNPIIVDEVSHYALEYFYFCALQNLERFEPSPIWHHIVDRMQTDLALRSAAAAIGRQQLVSHTAMMDETGEATEDGDDQATLLYVRAIASLRQSITQHSEADEIQGLNHVLASLLLVILESLRGSPHSLLVHLHSGIRIIRELNARPRKHNCGGGNGAFGSTTTQECTRLLHQYAVNTMVFNPASESTRTTQQLVWETSNQDSSHGVHLMPSQRASCEQRGYPLAVPSALSLTMPVHEFQREVKLTCRGMTSDLLRLMSKARGVVDPYEDPEIKAAIESMKIRQQNAEDIITARIKMILEQPPADADRCISNLKFALAHCVLTRISLAAAWTGLQSTYDDHLASFQEIVALEKSALELLRRANALLSDQSPIQPVFSLGISAIPVLMCVVRQCRDFSTRREAVALLDMCPKREGLWEAEKTRVICEAIIHFEQRKAGGIVPIPERCRIHFYQLTGLDTGSSDSSSSLKVALKPCAEQRTFMFETIALRPYSRGSDF